MLTIFEHQRSELHIERKDGGREGCDVVLSIETREGQVQISFSEGGTDRADIVLTHDETYMLRLLLERLQ